ncbi:hypothetical protein EYF80_049908 [Liparis tanakae]|uniref:Uncharacterized protein n=1 Tax=Liparis tanakae TaxID=230148 RepID=A0A4Z2FFG9_9TELE|nr:hypothetical protein EYF80_049908 [Liparis tanakae]
MKTGPLKRRRLRCSLIRSRHRRQISGHCFCSSKVSLSLVQKNQNLKVVPVSFWAHHGVLGGGGRPGGVVVRAGGVRAVEAALGVVAVVQDHPQQDLVVQGVLQRRGEVGGVDTGVVVDVGPGPQQAVDELVVALPERHLQAADGVLVDHGAGLQQQAGAAEVVVGHGEEEGRPAPVSVAAAHPRVQHEVGIVAGFEERLHAVGVAPRGGGVEGAHPALLHGVQLGDRDEALQGPVEIYILGLAND